MKHLDLTIDMETCALTANAAVMQVAVVPWFRDNDSDPFSNEPLLQPYVGYIDLRTCVVDGFDFDPSTLAWWSKQSEAAKRAVTDGFAEPIADVLVGVLEHIRHIVEKYQLTSICLWCQGPDVDIAILRNLCKKYDVDLDDIVPHTQFRDCRTLILEAAYALSRKMQRDDSLADPSPMPVVLPSEILVGDYNAYKLYEPLPEQYAAGSEAHDALYDALRSSWNTWQALRWLT